MAPVQLDIEDAINIAKLAEGLARAESQNEQLRIKCDEQSDRIAELEKEIAQMLQREASL